MRCAPFSATWTLYTETPERDARWARATPTRRARCATTTRGLTTRRRSRRAVSNALFELTALAGLDVRREVHDAVLELSRARVVPTATAQVLRSLASKAADARAAGLEDALRAPARE